MTSKQDFFLDPALEVDPGEVKWYFISDYYDGPIAGLAVFRGRILWFSCFEEDIAQHTLYVLQELSDEELEYEIEQKERFERMVGTHLSFDLSGEPLPRVTASEECQARYFRECEHERFFLGPLPRPIVAWFDVEPRKAD
ncbi:hypothetical protein [Luteolibacter sp. LG18]|uniref:hypothetical protein n=1 Tax=Luteolibacter sp. LG18 TaxID=2819286 RepID=UPI002B2ADEBE|nr:hypothetical protein llg_00880 [Luteolibacter sp. LG18]